MKYTEVRKTDVTNHIEKKGQFSYLSWAWAVDKLQELDPDCSWEYGEYNVFPDGSMMVYCTVNAFGKSRTSQLPVLDFKNKPIQNPSAFDVNTAMQRCLVKAIALHGLGLHIYAGEDLPPEDAKPEYDPEDLELQQQTLIDIQRCESKDDLDKLCVWEKIEALPDDLKEGIEEQLANKEKQLKNGVPNSFKPKWRFDGVDDANKWMIKVKPVIDNFKTADQVMEWQTYNQPKIDGLDILKAEKYKKDGKSPKERFTAALLAKYNELNQQAEAAE